jgi:hypothetical protein
MSVRAFLGLAALICFQLSTPAWSACAPSPAFQPATSAVLAWGVTYHRSGAVHVVTVDLDRASLIPGFHAAATAAQMLGRTNTRPPQADATRVFAIINGGFFDPRSKRNASFGVTRMQVIEPDWGLQFTAEQEARIVTRSILMLPVEPRSGRATAFITSPLQWFADRNEPPQVRRIEELLTEEAQRAAMAGWELTAIQGGGRLLPFDRDSSSYDRGGSANDYNPDPGFDGVTSRTAVGISGRCAFLVTVDKPGVTIARLARVMTAIGAADAIAFDGGGSTQMAITGTAMGSDVQEVSRNDSPVRTVASSIAVFAYPSRFEITPGIAARHLSADEVFFDRSIEVLIPGGVTRVFLAVDRSGTRPASIDDFAVVDVAGPEGAGRAVINANDAHGRPQGEQWMLSNVIPVSPGRNTIRIRLTNGFAPAGPNAGSSAIWLGFE